MPGQRGKPGLSSEKGERGTQGPIGPKVPASKQGERGLQGIMNPPETPGELAERDDTGPLVKHVHETLCLFETQPRAEFVFHSNYKLVRIGRKCPCLYTRQHT